MTAEHGIPILPAWRANHLIIRAFLLRSAAIWFVVRLALTTLLVVTSAPIVLSRAATVEMVLIIVALSYVEIGRRRERALLANLGLPIPVVLAICAVPPLLAEAFLNLAGRLIP